MSLTPPFSRASPQTQLTSARQGTPGRTPCTRAGCGTGGGLAGPEVRGPSVRRRFLEIRTRKRKFSVICWRICKNSLPAKRATKNKITSLLAEPSVRAPWSLLVLVGGTGLYCFLLVALVPIHPYCVLLVRTDTNWSVWSYWSYWVLLVSNAFY